MHLRQLGSGNWQAVITHRGHQRKVTRRTRAEAQLAAAQLLVEMGGPAADGADMTVDDLLVAWLIDAEHSATYRSDVLSIVARLPATFTRRPISTVTVPLMNALYRELAGSLSPHRLRRVHEIVGAAYRYAISMGWATFNPSTAARKPKVPPRKITPPDAATVARLLRATRGSQLGLYVAVAAEIGSRRGETVALQWADITGHTIRVERSLAYTVETGVIQTEGKTGEKGHRNVTITKELTALLTSEHAKQAELAMAAGFGRPMWVFSHDAGLTPWRPDYATKQFGKLCGALKITSVRLHDLRHFNVSQLLAAGVPVAVVAGRVGHSVTSTTQGVYSHYVKSADEAAAATMGALLAPGNHP